MMCLSTRSRRSLLALCSGGLAATAGCLERDTTYEAWKDVDHIALDAYTDRWVGIAPAVIDGETDPELVLLEDEEYRLTCRNGDGEPHRMTIRDEMGSVVQDYRFEMGAEEGETRTIQFRALPQMAMYTCETNGRATTGPITLYNASDTSVPAISEYSVEK